MRSLLDRALGAYLGLAIGDALGATVEFMTPREIAVRHGVHREMVGGGWLKLARGQVTDDTTMCLALGDALLQGGLPELHAFLQGDTALPQRIGHAYVRWWRGKPVDCGNTCRRGIMRFMHDGSLQGPPNEGDAGNGALMRNLPAVLATLAGGVDPRSIDAYLTRSLSTGWKLEVSGSAGLSKSAPDYVAGLR